MPTFAETYKDFDIDVWFGVAAPGRTPKAAIAELIDWFTEAMRSPEIVAKLDTQGLYPAVTCGDGSARSCASSTTNTAASSAKSNMKAD